eukprot:bmy_16001T0
MQRAQRERRGRRRRICGLSFSPDDGDEDPEGGDPEGKDAAVDTSFLPDRERAEVEATPRSWHGCGPRRAARIHRGGTARQLLSEARMARRPAFRELRGSGRTTTPSTTGWWRRRAATAGRSSPSTRFTAHPDISITASVPLSRSPASSHR